MNQITLSSRILLAFLFLLPSNLSAQLETSCIRAKKVIKVIQENHFSPREIDEGYAMQVSEFLAENLDPRQTILSLTDVEKINSLSPLILKELTGEGCEFLVQVAEIFAERLEVKEKMLVQLADYQWKENIGEGSISLKAETKFASASEFDKKVKFRLNAELITEFLVGEEKTATFDKAAFQAKGEGFVQRERCLYQRLRTNTEAANKYVGNAYLSAIASAFDPHTNYFSEDMKGDFMAQMSTENYSFGLETDLNSVGEVEIIGLVPGSSAWNSNQLNEGDILLSVKAEKLGSKEFSCAETEEAIELISSMFLTEATFTIRKKSGKIIEVDLYKSTQAATENIVQSFILEGDKKIGYIYLPSFYSVEVDGKGCGDAVAKELIRLKREGIEALIFDIRNNGGGSFDEALKISGMFIDYGAVSMTDLRGQDPTIFKDPARGKLFSAPLILLQNRLSASASELFAATMQDYNRALIVGSPSFGKSTVQTVIPLSSWRKGRLRVTVANSGYVKTTIGKFYRVTGESHQKEGVQPDILLPETVIYQRFGENTYSNSLEKDKLDKDSYFKELSAIPKEIIAENSEKRVTENATFQALISSNTLLKKMEKERFIVSAESLEPLVDVLQSAGEYKDENEAPFKVEIPTYLQSFAQDSEEMKTFNTSMLEALEGNIYVREAYQIGLEMLDK